MKRIIILAAILAIMSATVGMAIAAGGAAPQGQSATPETYAIVKDGVVVNAVLVSPDAVSQGKYKAPPGTTLVRLSGAKAGAGDTYVGPGATPVFARPAEVVGQSAQELFEEAIAEATTLQELKAALLGVKKINQGKAQARE